MRELVYTITAGNPYIKPEDKPTKEQIIKLSSDEKVKKKKTKKLDPEEVEKIRQELISKMNGTKGSTCTN